MGASVGPTVSAVPKRRRADTRTRVLLAVLLALLAALRLGCANRLAYWPSHKVYGTPADDGLAFEEVTFASGDGTRLSGWFVPAVGEAEGTVVQFHGNAQNMTAHFDFVSWLPVEGFNVFVFDYRGYGRSAGWPRREGIYQDCIAALDYIAGRADVDPDRIVVLGQSLGGANAVAVLGESDGRGVAAVAVDSSFYSYRHMARAVIRRVPLVGLLRWPLSFLVVTNGRSPGPVAGRIAPTPMLFFHGTGDRVVPHSQGEMLYDAAGEPKEFVTTPDGGHIDAFIRREPLYREKLVAFFRSALAERHGDRAIDSDRGGPQDAR